MALVSDQKFSTFQNGGDLILGDIVVGLRDGINTKFNWEGMIETITGTANQINVNSVDPENPIISLSTTINTPGTFSVLSTTTINAIINDDTMATATAMNVPTSLSVVNYVASVVGSAAGGSNGQIQYNNAGAFGGDSGFITNGSGTISITGQLNVDNLRIDGNTLSSTNANGELYFDPDNGGALITGTTATIGQISSFLGGSSSTGIWYMVGSNATLDDPDVWLLGLNKEPRNISVFTASSTIGVHGAVSDGSNILTNVCFADDGVTFKQAGSTAFAVTGTVSPGIIPTRFYVQNMDETGTLRVPFAIFPSGDITCTKKISALNFLPFFTTTVTAAGTTTLTVDSGYLQYFTGSTNQTVVMPVTSTLTQGQSWRIVNNSSGIVTVNSSGGNLIVSMATNTTAEITCILTSGTTAASWNSTYISDAGASGIVSPGTINQLAWYAATGSTVSGLTGANSAVLVTTSAGVPGFTSSMTNGQLVIGSTGATPTAATLTAGTGISISNGSGSITVSSSGGGVAWSEITGASQLMVINTGYIANNAGGVSFTMPGTCALGDSINVVGKGAGGWSITPNTGQTIQVGSQVSGTGVLGVVASSNRYDSICLVCTTANTVWTALGAPQSSTLSVL